MLELCQDALSEKGFVYKSDVLRIVYIHKNMSVKEEIEALIHETGHVLLDREIDSKGLMQAKATLFSEYVLGLANNQTVAYKLWKIKNPIIAIILSLIALFAGNQYYNALKIKPLSDVKTISVNAEQFQKDKIYVTPKGKKYHTYTCRYITPEKAIELTIEKAERDNYEPCKVCKPKH